MSIIRVLDDHIANQIAAGEVVERPSSVVKELVENAVDAGSTRIDVTVEEGGLSLIRIVDNGTGIAPNDLERAFQRHATSKIATGHDLFRIRTLGFRGEALPSIAAVAKVECVSAVDGSGLGRRLGIEGGTIKVHEDAAASKGTDLRVKELFFNTPARLKYMKTIQTELGHISDYMYRLALAHPEIAFTLTHNGTQLLQTLGHGDLLQVIAGIYGTALAKQMLPIQGESLDYRLSGYVSKPELTRSNRNGVTTVINGRYIKNYALVQTLLRAFHTLLPINRFPLAVLHLEMDPTLLDVNVHPSKLEVRFSKESELLALLEETVKKMLGGQVHIPQGGRSGSAAAKPAVVQEQLALYRPGAEPRGREVELPAGGTGAGTNGYTAADAGADASTSLSDSAIGSSSDNAIASLSGNTIARSSYNANAIDIADTSVGDVDASTDVGTGTFTGAGIGARTGSGAGVSTDATEASIGAGASPSNSRPAAAEEYKGVAPFSKETELQGLTKEHRATNSVSREAADASNTAYPQAGPSSMRAATPAAMDPASAERMLQALQPHKDASPQLPAFPQLEPIGQLHGTYIVAQNPDGLYLIDQHAAHERIHYEYYYELFGKPVEASQELLVPIPMEFTAMEASLLQTRLPYLEQVGVFLESFGGGTYLVRAYPHWFPQGEEEGIIQEMVDWLLAEKKAIDLARLREKSSTLCSCKASIKANQSITKVEMEALLDRLASCRIPYTCPHGRPIVISFSSYELEKMFKRVM